MIKKGESKLTEKTRINNKYCFAKINQETLFINFLRKTSKRKNFCNYFFLISFAGTKIYLN